MSRLNRLLFFILFNFIFHLSASETSPDYTLEIPMRDGFTLLTDIYLPSPDAKNLPCILVRSPAGRKEKPWQASGALSKFGYVVAIQDTRSISDTEGKTFPYFSDGWGLLQDGYDTVEWLAKQPITNGMIGTMGVSAGGITQLFLAPTNPPSLKCQYIGVAAGSIYHHGTFPGGQLLKNQVEGWLSLHAKDTSVLSHACNLPFYNNFWENFDSIKVADRVNVPAIIYGGWYDTFLLGTLDSFIARQTRGASGAAGKQKLIIGPWTHHWPSNKLGDFLVPEHGMKPPIDMSPIRWFDHYLKGIANDAENLPPITYYVMGPFDGTPSKGNVWKTADSWPIPHETTSFYLTADQKLVKQDLEKKEKTFKYIYDPRNPILTRGGCNLFLESGPMNQQQIEKRPDVLIFTTETLEEDLEITGPLYAKLYFSSDCLDTDVVVRLTDVYPDGKSILVADGIFRTGVLQHQQEVVQPVKDQPHEISIDLWSTSIVFAKGHKIRISVSSSNYPRYEKNLNIGLLGKNTGCFAIANNALYVGGAYQSRLILPVIK